jgi:hypothetical protein
MPLNFKTLVDKERERIMIRNAYTLGVDAFYEGGVNPFKKDSDPWKEWEGGYLDARFLKDITDGKDEFTRRR